jgi:hypothetical protein
MPVLLILTSVFLNRVAVIGKWTDGLLPYNYNDPLIDGKKNLYGWAIMIIYLLVSFIYYYKITANQYMLIISQMLVGALCLYFGSHLLLFNDDLQLKQMTYLAQQKEWNKLLSAKIDDKNVYLKLNLINYSLANKGDLSNSLFKYDQKGVKGLVGEWNSTLVEALIYSDIHYFLDDIASSKKYAFEGLVSSIRGGSPYLVKTLIKTHIIYGEYAVAEKYISLLEKTLFYRTWAKNQRKYLFNNEAVLGNKEYSEKRLSLGGESNCSTSTLLIETLNNILKNTQKRVVAEYLSSFFLLSKDMNKYYSFIEDNYGKPYLKSLSENEQEAIIFMFPETKSLWIKYSVGAQVQKRFDMFSQESSFLRDKLRIKSLLQKNYPYTYWNYVYNK